MSEHANEPVDPDLLLAFSTEPDAKPNESNELLNVRVDHLERMLAKSARQVSSLESELATLVGRIEDIKTIRTAPVPRLRPRSRTAFATAGVMLAILGSFGWRMWPGNSAEAPAPALSPVSVEQPAEPEATPEPVTALAVAKPEARPGLAARAVPVRFPTERPVNYVGTLSIDAAPGGDVFIDRRPAGRTPLRVPDLKAGSHLVWIERDGYRRFTRVVQVPADRVSRVWADLEPLAIR